MTKYIGPKTDGENVATQADKLSLSSETPDALTPDQTGAAGTATTAARSDHQHEILAGAAGTITGVSNAEGSSTSFARADHTHQIKPPAVRATHSTTVTTTNNAWTVLAFDGEDFDTDNLHDNATNNSRLTASQAGLYFVVGYVIHDTNTTGERGTNIFVNGTTEDAQTWGPASSFSPRHTVSSLISLAQNDYVQLRAWQNSSANRTVTPKFFSMIRVGTAP